MADKSVYFPQHASKPPPSSSSRPSKKTNVKGPGPAAGKYIGQQDQQQKRR